MNNMLKNIEHGMCKVRKYENGRRVKQTKNRENKKESCLEGGWNNKNDETR